MATQQQLAYRHKKYSQRKRSREDENYTAFSTDSDSSLEPDQEHCISNLPKQRKLQTNIKLTPKEKFKTEKAINELRLRIQLIDLNDNEPSEKIDRQTKDHPKRIAQKESTVLPSSPALRPSPSTTTTSTFDSNGNILKYLLAKRARSKVSTSTKNTEKESLSDEEINEKLIKLDIPLPLGPPPNRRVTFGGFSHMEKIDTSSTKKTKQVTFEEFDRPGKIAKDTKEHSDTERIKFSSKKMGRSKTIKEINIEDEWKIYKTANLSFSEFATRTSSFGTK